MVKKVRQMRPVVAHREALEAFCRRWSVRELSLFGSARRDDFNPASDVDLLVTFEEEARPTLLDLSAMQEELEAIFQRPVDLVEREGLKASHNWIRRAAILRSAEPMYRAA